MFLDSFSSFAPGHGLDLAAKRRRIAANAPQFPGAAEALDRSDPCVSSTMVSSSAQRMPLPASSCLYCGDSRA
jgi:hypothetical protein